MKVTIALVITALVLLIAVPLQAGSGSAPTRTAPATEGAPRSLTVEDYFRLGRVADPKVSPDGRWVAYTVSTSDLVEDEKESRIWMVPMGGGEAVAMTAKASSASEPRWSPDGRYLSFLAEKEGGKEQVYTLFRQGGEAVQLTDTAQGVSSYEWSPDGQRLVLVLKDPKPEELKKKEKGEKGSEEEKTPDPWVIDRRQFKQDYVGYLDSRRTHLYLYDIGSKELTQVTSGDFDDSQPAWSPDGQFIAFVSNRTADPDANYNADIWVVAADTSDQGGTLRQITTNLGEDRSPAWSPDGASITYVAATDTEAVVYATYHLAVAPASGGKAEVLTEELDRQISKPRYSADGDSILFMLEDSGESNLARIPAGGGSVARLISGPRIVRDFDFGPNGAIAVLVSEPHLPEEVFSFAAGRLERLSHTNDELLADIRLGEVEEIQLESVDGTAIEAFVVRPPQFDHDSRYPAILRIHGGPVAQYDFGFDYRAQLYAANGYVVVLPNPRGSSGYGQDFSLGIWQSWGERDYEDVMAAVDAIVERGDADPDRLGVGGWSYGGMLTNHVVTKTDRFKAAVTGASATLYVANYGHDQYQRWWEYELGLPWENRDLWEELSPFNKVDKIHTPTLIIGGEKDWNVPIINSEQLYLALRRLGRTTQLVVYPGEYHGIATPSYIKDLFERELQWYGKYVKGEALEE